MFMVSTRSVRLFLIAFSLYCSMPSRSHSAEPIDFGSQIQPIFAKRCFACHGPDKAEGGLRLDRKESAYAQLESGKTALRPKQVAQSEIIRRATSTDETVRMPPEGAPLTPSQIDLLKHWIEQGADWKEHWAFEAPKQQSPPTVNNGKWVTNSIDKFVLSKLEQHGLTPAPVLERSALLRRVTYDLTGLPPTTAEVESFVTDQSLDAYEKVVDRLLQSTHFGEHWARHWLDVVRYADTNSFERDGLKPNAWRYRDYVIRSFNSDKPYDRFIREQLAGDELPDGGNDGLIATGFYRLGLWDDEPADRLLATYDVLDDIITTTAQGFLGLTVNCARCHDHKIDPIPQRDYYSLLAFFRGVTPNGNPNPNVERPIFENDAEKQAYEAAVKEYQQQLNSVQATVTTIEKEFRELLSQQDQVSDQPDLDELEYRFYRDTWTTLPDFDNLKPEKIAKLEKGFIDISPASREFSFGFTFRGTLKVPSDGEYLFVIDSDDGSRLTLNGEQIVTYDGIHGLGKPRSGKVILKEGRLPLRVDYFQGEAGEKGLVIKWSGPGFESRLLSSSAEGSVKGDDQRAKRKEFAAAMKTLGPTILGADRHAEYTTSVDRLNDLKRHKIEPSYALCVTETGPNPPETNLLKRGNPQSPGDQVAPAFLTSLGGETPRIPATASTVQSSGRRLVLADWIASTDNRLTARVMMNRLWQHYFGRGIVRSPNNFGLLGDRPTHPELLDWLAIEFMKGGTICENARDNPAASESTSTKSTRRDSLVGIVPWSMKRMHRLIVMSSTYRMSSRWAQTSERSESNSKNSMPVDPHAADPMNNLFWKHDMRRLSAEEIRDSILAVDGQLNTKMYGRGIFPNISDEVKAGQSIPGSGWGESPSDEQSRRSVYVQVKRSLLLPILSDFDFADTDGSCAARFTTTQPTQALGMLNGEFLNQQSTEFARRIRREAGNDLRQQVILAFRLALCRNPDRGLVERGMSLVETLKTRHGLSADSALDKFCLMTLNLNEFIYLD